jgi:ribose 5-phosphate isomerase B
MKISIGADHRGYLLKGALIAHFSDVAWLDVGTSSSDRVNYPLFAKQVCDAVLDHTTDVGILICGSGIGMSIAANRYKHIYAALCWHADVARYARMHDQANILILPADFVSIHEACKITAVWMATEFMGGVYQERLDMLDI